MIVSIPIATTSQTCSEPSKVRTLDMLAEQFKDDGYTIAEGLDIVEDTNGRVYRYSLPKPSVVRVFKQGVVGAHKVGDIVISNGKHYEVIATDMIKGTKTPKQPEDYSNTETSMSNWKAWTGRYVRVTGYRGKWTVGDRCYWLQTPNQCSKCKDLEWHAWDKTTNGCYSDLYYCLKNSYSKSFSIAKDIQAEKKVWGGGASVKEDTLIIKSVIFRGKYTFMRTWTDAPIEYDVVTQSVQKYGIKRIFSPAEITGFKVNRIDDCGAAFDDKNYTKGVFTPTSGKVNFMFTTTGWSDTIAIGRVFAESVSIAVRDTNNNLIFTIYNYKIDNEIGLTGVGQDANVIIYSDKTIPPDSTVTVHLIGGYITVGRILSGRTMSLGFTNTVFDNGFRDLSPKEQDQWGNIEYRNGIRMYLHGGTVDLPLKDYDQLNRAMMYIGGKELIINSSDSRNNSPTNSLSIFQSTMLIGRFTLFKQRTKNIGDLMDSVATFNFTIEESN